MKNSIETTVFTDAVEGISVKLNVSTREAWNIMYNMGLDFIDTLQVRITRKRVFDLQFRAMFEKPGFGSLTPETVFAAIKHAPEFWDWWANKVFFACADSKEITDQASLMYALEFTESIIPIFTLNKIFYAKHKESGSSKAIGDAPGKEISPAANPAARVGNRVGSRV